MQQEQTDPILHNYYLENFQILTDFVFSNYEELLSDDERYFYQALNRQPTNARLLCIRLLMRRGEYVRVSKIGYPEVEPVSVAFQQLQSAGLIQLANPENLVDWIGCFTREELASVTPRSQLGIFDSPTTPDLLGDTPTDLIQRLDTVYHVCCKPHYQIFLLLFFGNLYQDLSEFILRDLGLRDYEQTLTDTTALPFHSREQLMAYWQYYHCYSCFEDAAALGTEALHTLFEELPKNTFNDPVLKRRIHQFYNKIARQLERETALEQAARIYQLSDFPPARERLARVEAGRGNHHRALEICSDITVDPANSEELEFARQFTIKISRKIGAEAPQATIYQPPEISIALPSSALSVERATALYFARDGHCYYVENSLLTAAFGLAFWDIIFAPIPGVFFNPFQRAPLDFYDKHFTDRRNELIEERRRSIEQENLREHLFTHFHRKRGLINPLVHWQSVNFTLLSLAVSRISTKDWCVIFDYLLKDIKNHRSGLPDLIFFPNAGGYQLLEVKGPGDSLQKHQRRWMKHFNKNNISHAVVNADYKKQTPLPRSGPQLVAV